LLHCIPNLKTNSPIIKLEWSYRDKYTLGFISVNPHQFCCKKELTPKQNVIIAKQSIFLQKKFNLSHYSFFFSTKWPTHPQHTPSDKTSHIIIYVTKQILKTFSVMHISIIDWDVGCSLVIVTFMLCSKSVQWIWTTNRLVDHCL